jgi:hypothetical protein
MKSYTTCGPKWGCDRSLAPTRKLPVLEENHKDCQTGLQCRGEEWRRDDLPIQSSLVTRLSITAAPLNNTKEEEITLFLSGSLSRGSRLRVSLNKTVF